MKAKNHFLVLFALVLLLCSFSSCGNAQPHSESTISTQSATVPPFQETEIPTVAPVTEPKHSELYIPDIPVEDVIVYFNEVCLDSEITHSGDPSYVQKWAEPIFYSLHGDYTEEDLIALSSLTRWLNTIDSFPGIFETLGPEYTNLQIHFCSQSDMIDLMGENFWGMDGAVTFWYSNNEIYDSIICCRSDLDQYLRNSVIIEELYNGLGPVQDTSLRQDSIIYQGFSQPQWLSPIDELILQLLYHPDMQPGMNAQQCEQVIRSLYY